VEYVVEFVVPVIELVLLILREMYHLLPPDTVEYVTLHHEKILESSHQHQILLHHLQNHRLRRQETMPTTVLRRILYHNLDRIGLFDPRYLVDRDRDRRR